MLNPIPIKKRHHSVRGDKLEGIRGIHGWEDISGQSKKDSKQKTKQKQKYTKTEKCPK